MEINTRKALETCRKLIVSPNDITIYSELTELIFHLGYYCGKASIISGGDKKWIDQLFPLLKKNDIESMINLLKSFLDELEERKKLNKFDVI